MQQPAPPKLPNEVELVGLSHSELIGIARSQAQRIETLTAQLASVMRRLEWFERNLFGVKSERLRVLENDRQLALGEVLAPPRYEHAGEGAHRGGTHTAGSPARCRRGRGDRERPLLR